MTLDEISNTSFMDSDLNFFRITSQNLKLLIYIFIINGKTVQIFNFATLSSYAFLY